MASDEILVTLSPDELAELDVDPRHALPITLIHRRAAAPALVPPLVRQQSTENAFTPPLSREPSTVGAGSVGIEPRVRAVRPAAARARGISFPTAPRFRQPSAASVKAALAKRTAALLAPAREQSPKRGARGARSHRARSTAPTGPGAVLQTNLRELQSRVAKLRHDALVEALSRESAPPPGGDSAAGPACASQADGTAAAPSTVRRAARGTRSWHKWTGRDAAFFSLYSSAPASTRVGPELQPQPSATWGTARAPSIPRAPRRALSSVAGSGLGPGHYGAPAPPTPQVHGACAMQRASATRPRRQERTPGPGEYDPVLPRAAARHTSMSWRPLDASRYSMLR